MSVRVENLTVEYATGGYTVRPLDGLSLEANAGELVLLLGPSGSGKTTLLSCLGGILKPSSGAIHVQGVAVHELEGKRLTHYRRHGVGIVFQAFNLVPSLTSTQNVAAPLLVSGVDRSAALAKARDLLRVVGLEQFADRLPGHMSGGQQQRVAVARALIREAPLLLADEPTANLDHIQAEAVIRLLRDLRDPSRTIIVSTHDHRLVPIADRVIDLAAVAAIEDAPIPSEIRLTKGKVLFRQGEPSDFIYEVRRGAVEVVRELADGNQQVLAVIEAGSFVGELGPMLGFPRSATVRAAKATTLRPLRLDQFRSELLETSRS